MTSPEIVFSFYTVRTRDSSSAQIGWSTPRSVTRLIVHVTDKTSKVLTPRNRRMPTVAATVSNNTAVYQQCAHAAPVKAVSTLQIGDIIVIIIIINTCTHTHDRTVQVLYTYT